MFLVVVSLIMILKYLFLASLSNPLSIGLNIILCRSLTNTCNYNFGTNCGAVWPPMVILIQLLAIGYWTNWGWWRIQWYNTLLTCSIVFQTCIFGILDHNWFPDIIALCFDFAAHNLRKAIFGLTSNVVENWRSDFLALGCLIDTDEPYDIGMFSEKPQVCIPW